MNTRCTPPNVKEEEVVYSAEMDGELKKLLQELGGSMKQIAGRNPAPDQSAADLGQLRRDMHGFQTDLSWHRNIGWVLAAIYATIFAGFLTWYLPGKLSDTKESIGKDFRIELNAQLAPILKELAAIDARSAVRSPDAKRQVGAVIKQSVEGIANVATSMTQRVLDLETLKVVGQEAKQEGIRSDPTILSISAERLATAIKQPKIRDGAWQAVLALMDYRSFLNSDSVPQLPPPSQNGVPPSNLPIIRMVLFGVGQSHYPDPLCALSEPIDHPIQPLGGACSRWVLFDQAQGSIPLDGGRFRNVIFKNVAISYKGGPVSLESVLFVNCTFDVSSDKGEKFGIAVLRASAVSLSISSS